MSEKQEKPQELKIALIGESGVGKTTFLSSFYGNLLSENFLKTYGYHLIAENAGQGNFLLAKYHELEKGKFPQPTTQIEKYTFDFRGKDLDANNLLKITFYDYPGGWWNSESPYTEIERKKMLRELSECHGGLILIDGYKYLKEGTNYIEKSFKQIKSELIKNYQNPPERDISLSWIIAITKADLLPIDKDPTEIWKEIITDCKDEINGINRALQNDGFGSQFMLVSSVKASKENTVENAHSFKGLNLIVPLFLTEELAKIGAQPHPSVFPQNPKVIAQWLKFFKRVAPELIRLIDSLDDILGEKYQYISKVLKAFGLIEWANLTDEELKKEKIKVQNQKKYLDELLISFEQEIRTDSRLYYRNQRIK